MWRDGSFRRGAEIMTNQKDAIDALLAIAAGIAIGAGIAALLKMLSEDEDEEEW